MNVRGGVAIVAQARVVIEHEQRGVSDAVNGGLVGDVRGQLSVGRGERSVRCELGVRRAGGLRRVELGLQGSISGRSSGRLTGNVTSRGSVGRAHEKDSTRAGG